jgi:hypothetical protein
MWIFTLNLFIFCFVFFLFLIISLLNFLFRFENIENQIEILFMYNKMVFSLKNLQENNLKMRQFTGNIIFDNHWLKCEHSTTQFHLLNSNSKWLRVIIAFYTLGLMSLNGLHNVTNPFSLNNKTIMINVQHHYLEWIEEWKWRYLIA